MPSRLASDQPQSRQVLGQAPRGDGPFEARQGCAEAEMDAVAEGHVHVLRPADIEALWILDRLGIAIGRIDEGEDALALSDRLAAQFEIGSGHAGK